ncbi:MAG: hypothetical protein WB716_08575 [Candidatus Acidiferrales bacterium]
MSNDHDGFISAFAFARGTGQKSMSYVYQQLQLGRIAGARKLGRKWQIPVERVAEWRDKRATDTDAVADVEGAS